MANVTWVTESFTGTPSEIASAINLLTYEPVNGFTVVFEKLGNGIFICTITKVNGGAGALLCEVSYGSVSNIVADLGGGVVDETYILGCQTFIFDYIDSVGCVGFKIIND